MSVPLYGFLDGDTIGVLIMADEDETIESLTRKLQLAGSIRVAPQNDVNLTYRGKIIDPALTVSEAGLRPLERVDVRERQCHGVSEGRDLG